MCVPLDVATTLQPYVAKDKLADWSLKSNQHYYGNSCKMCKCYNQAPQDARLEKGEVTNKIKGRAHHPYQSGLNDRCDWSLCLTTCANWWSTALHALHAIT